MKKAVAVLLSFLLVMAFMFQVSAISTIAVKGIKLNSTKVSLKVGDTYGLKATLTPSNTTQKALTYASANKNVASVDKTGKITGVAKGATTITVYTANKKVLAKCSVTVAEPKPVSLRFSWWGDDTRHKPTLDAINAYMKKNPYVKISGEYAGWDGYGDKVNTEISAGTLPDIVQFPYQNVGGTPNINDVFIDMNQYKNIINTSGFDASFLKNYAMSDGHLIGLPTGVSGLVFYTNNPLLQKAGIQIGDSWDWDQFISYGQKIHEQNKDEYLLNCDIDGLYGQMFIAYVIQTTGEQFIKNDFTPGFNEAALLKAFTLIKDIYAKGVAQPYEESYVWKGKFEQNPKWVNKQFGGVFGWTSNAPLFQKALGNDMGVVSMPIVKNTKATGVIVAPAQLLCVYKQSKSVAESAKFVNWFLNDPEAVTILGACRSTPAAKSARDLLTSKNVINPLTSKGLEIAIKHQGFAETANTTNAEIQNIFWDAIESVAMGKVQPDQAAKDAMQKVNDKLAELKQAAG